jgi:hypothetical protein
MNQQAILEKLKEVSQNPTIRQIYAKQSCKHCYGRGIINLNNQDILCRCVFKNVRKEIKELYG